MLNDPASCKPSAYYYRRELRAARTKAALLEVALHLVCELEQHKAWSRTHGLIPPRWFVTPSERRAKPPGSVSLLPSTTAASAKAE